MPNHVTQRLVITGPTAVVERFRRVHFTNGSEEQVLQELKELDGRVQELKVEIRAAAHGDPEVLERKRLQLAGVRHRIADMNKTLADIRSDEPGSNFCFETFFGAPAFSFNAPVTLDRQHANPRNWYAHNTSRWGTKWNAYSIDIEDIVEVEPGVSSSLTFRFDTAWSTPDPIYDLMARAWPELDIQIVYIDEGWNFWGCRRMFDSVISDNCFQTYEDDPQALQLLLWLERTLNHRDDADFAEMFDNLSEILNIAGVADVALLGLDYPFDDN